MLNYKDYERAVYALLQKNLVGYTVSGQLSKSFWKGESLSSHIRPDIVLQHATTMETIVLDTKWKNLNGKGPSADDLRQMYVYHEYFDARMVALVYPGEEMKISGSYFKKDQAELADKHCHVLQIPADADFVLWKQRIVEQVFNTIN